MALRRPVCLCGAAFLVTTAAALYAPVLLFFLALFIACALLFLPAHHRVVAVGLGVGCLTALLASGFFFVRLHRAGALAGSTLSVHGSIFYHGHRQLAAVALEDGRTALVRLLPTLEGAEDGDCFAGRLTITQALPDSDHFLQSKGVLLDALPTELQLTEEGEPSRFIRTLLLRRRLCQKLLGRSPTPRTSVTAAVLFSYTDALPAPLRKAFSRSGMGHLLAVSGLHLSILVWGVVALVRRLRGGLLLQALVGASTAIFVLFAAGTSPSVFRAVLMALLTLSAGLFRRKSDGLTSLTLGAVLLVGVCPPILADLSFQLSFSAVLGILVLSPRLSAALEQYYLTHFSSCGRWAKGGIEALSVSIGAQLSTAPFLALAFGQLPLLGLFLNALAIPLVYPILLCGFASLLLPGTGAAVLLLKMANLCSGLLGLLATGAARLPFCSLSVLFPSGLLPLLPAVLLCLGLIYLPLRRRRLERLLGATVALTLLLAGVQLWWVQNSILVSSSSVTGSLILTYRGQSVLLEHAQSPYHRRLDALRLERLGTPTPALLLLPHPDDDPSQMAAAQEFYGLPHPQVYTAAQLDSPVSLFPGVTARVVQPYLTEIALGHTKLMKFFAVYDTIEPFSLPGQELLLADRPGNLLSVGGRPTVLRRANGDSFVRIYRSGGDVHAVYR